MHLKQCHRHLPKDVKITEEMFMLMNAESQKNFLKQHLENEWECILQGESCQTTQNAAICHSTIKQSKNK